MFLSKTLTNSKPANWASGGLSCTHPVPLAQSGHLFLGMSKYYRAWWHPFWTFQEKHEEMNGKWIRLPLEFSKYNLRTRGFLTPGVLWDQNYLQNHPKILLSFSFSLFDEFFSNHTPSDITPREHRCRFERLAIFYLARHLRDLQKCKTIPLNFFGLRIELFS